jgi:hypothetical protein
MDLLTFEVGIAIQLQCIFNLFNALGEVIGSRGRTVVASSHKTESSSERKGKAQHFEFHQDTP